MNEQLPNVGESKNAEYCDKSKNIVQIILHTVAAEIFKGKEG